MSEPRPSERGATARLNSLRFEPVRSSGRLDAAPSARLRGRPSHETQRLTPLQADLLGEVRTVRGRSARIGARLPQQERAGDGLAVARARSRSISVRLVAAVSARLAHPLQSVTREERFLARWTLALSAVSAPLAMLAFTVLVGLDLPRRRAAAEGAAAQVAARDAIEPLLTEPRAAAVAAPVEGARPLSEAPSPTLRPAAPRDLARAPGGGALAAAARRDRAREGHEPLSRPAGFRREASGPEALAVAQGGFAAWVGTPGATGDGARRLPLQLLALDRAWRELELEVGLPEGWRVREVLPGRALYEAGAELVTVRRAGGLSLRVLRPEGADPVGDGEVAVVVVQATAAGAVDVQVQTPGAAEAVAHVESRVVLD